ncbi:phosphotransferase family protein [Parvibaculum sp.]|uniref:phosphotransferase family protein n=1 Tax=Parvibaculum sp. TaxID=2024848 RepID=UPI001B2D1ED2|nr:phosphotransferase family protein [Parvibaculum sp.]MBO6635253.1 phosphotransferase family protein [Parvibaculum sp.]MBO6679829.1 phosphotransferase family protein [Parvibaculum sp.]MBO6683810.1 phosphotransferase family protein [Parvibaculum sp.]MBO6906234.1 phosphotransferase family protein [Parvibaculum sp.]
MEELAPRIAAYLAHRMPAASNIEVSGISRIHGGASRETFRLRARWEEGGKQVERALILRRDPVASLIETERDLEYNAYRAFHPTGLPVPEPLYLETDLEWLDRPFFVMEQIEGCAAGSAFNDDPYGAHAEKIGRQFWTHLGHIAAADPDAIGFSANMEPVAPGECWSRELEKWEKVIDEDELVPQPVARAAIRWLKRNPPPPAEKISVVHGDYRTGNFLYDGEGNIRAILDWEMCHLGDPLEDVAWASDPLWAFRQPERPGGMIARKEAFRIWEEASGMKIDPVRLRWWEIFNSLKGLAIWISAGKEYQTGANRDPVLAFSSWYCTDVHDRVLAKRLAALSKEARQ